MYTILIVISLMLVIVTAIVTVSALKQEEKKMKKYETGGFSYKDALKRSKEYEENSISTMLPVQILKYVADFVVVVILIHFLQFTIRLKNYVIVLFPGTLFDK
ncbi:hypothetical protein [Pseudogracilibacillus sp. SO30301A]|uniref:hypothetical protein n=1 Tax=Pseudogracilibacillus sp. SO30301A TaxID=3098291 RepID=UPI00300E16FD